MKILIIEKDDKIENSLKEFFKEYDLGVEFEIIKSFVNFKKIIETSPPDLILCNANIEGYPAFFFIKWLRVDKGLTKLPVILYSENPTREMLNLAKKYRVNSFILYPFKKNDLLERILKFLKIKEIKVNKKRDDKDIIDKIKSKIELLPPFPSVIHEIENLINSKKSSASDFEEVIKKDQVITAKVLKIVNSPFFSLQRKISTISESVAYIGFDTLRSVVYSAFTSKLLNVNLPAYDYKRNELWKHSYLTACFSKEISKYFDYSSKSQEEMFIGGLLHDIGKLILGSLAKEENIIFYREVDENTSIIDIEKRYFSISHEEAGKLIAEKWNLPEIHNRIISNHHLRNENSNDKDVAIVAISNLFSNKFLGFKILKYDEKEIEKAMSILSIEEKNVKELEEVCKKLMGKVEDV